MRWALIALGLTAAPAMAEVTQSSPTSFVITQSVTIAAPIDRAWATLRSPQKWWDKEHSYSGDSANLYLDSQATGCFCEKLPGKGSVEHGHLVYVEPPRALRMRTALGPLQTEGVDGALTITLEPEGEGTKLSLSYVVGGFARAGLDTLAPKVDEVLALQLAHLKEAAETAPAQEEAPAEGKPAVREHR
ncbi:MAG: SRPBCC family protein [Sphingomonas sp.]|nr:SRPBCC family protein [Sphingomonas sp.]